MSDDKGRNRYEPLRETHRRVAEELEARDSPEAPPASRQEPTAAAPDVDAFLEKVAAREHELDELVARGRITEGEKIWRLNQYDRQVADEIERAFPLPSEERGTRGGESAPSAAEHSPEELTSSSTREDDTAENDSGALIPDEQIEREAEEAAYEVVGRGEMTDARAARLARLQAVREAIEREPHENDGSNPRMGRDDQGDRSR